MTHEFIARFQLASPFGSNIDPFSVPESNVKQLSTFDVITTNIDLTLSQACGERHFGFVNPYKFVAHYERNSDQIKIVLIIDSTYSISDTGMWEFECIEYNGQPFTSYRMFEASLGRDLDNLIESLI